MKSKLLPTLLALVAGLACSLTALAAAQEKPAAPADAARIKGGHLVAPTDQDAAWLAKARASYPLKTCVVSNEELGGMGESKDMIYRQAGQPDRLVRFCCKNCLEDFEKDQAKYLQAITAAAKPAAAASYVCPMHADVTSTKADAKCPKCGMALVPAKGGKSGH
jgi:hypothetical protein